MMILTVKELFHTVERYESFTKLNNVSRERYVETVTNNSRKKTLVTMKTPKTAKGRAVTKIPQNIFVEEKKSILDKHLREEQKGNQIT